MSTTDPSPAAGTRDWQAIEVEPDFQELRRRLRSFVFPVTGGMAKTRCSITGPR